MSVTFREMGIKAKFPIALSVALAASLSAGSVSEKPSAVPNTIFEKRDVGPLMSASALTWRTPVTGGINVLYCYLRASGIVLAYPKLRAELIGEVGTNTETALTLTHLAEKHGVLLRPVLLTLAELKRCPKPVITHMDGENLDAGAFLLVLGVSDKSVFLVNGTTASIQSISEEDFCRVWSRLALLPATNLQRSSTIGFIGLGAGLFLLPFCRLLARLFSAHLWRGEVNPSFR